MDVCKAFSSAGYRPINCIELHTDGMPARIIFSGYPDLEGTLSEQKAQAAKDYDYIRKRVLFEPRGHVDMYGAILRPRTERVKSGEAHMGVLFIHTDGYSNLCGHATVGLSRFLVDTHDVNVFPLRNALEYDPISMTVLIKLHTPGGIVEVMVPTTPNGSRSDPSRSVAFNAIPAFALATELDVFIPHKYRWPELREKERVKVSIAYCGAFSCHVSLQELGFSRDALHENPNFTALKIAAKQVKEVINGDQHHGSRLKIPYKESIGSIYGVMIVDKAHGVASEGTLGAETGLYIYGDQHIDRSPTGSVAAARAAIAFANGELNLGESWTYHSVVSNASKASRGLVATVVKVEDMDGIDDAQLESIKLTITANIKGYAYYTGCHTFVVEEDDYLGKGGFLLEQLE